MINMFKISVEKDCEDREEAAEFLRYVARQVDEGFWSGDGWDSTDEKGEEK